MYRRYRRGEGQQGAFRQDLYYRVNVVIIFLPPLRDRRGDILLLADCFVEEYSKKMAKKVWRGGFGECLCVDRYVVVEVREGGTMQSVKIVEAGCDDQTRQPRRSIANAASRRVIRRTSSGKKSAMQILDNSQLAKVG
jgi:hypothetical protein